MRAIEITTWFVIGVASLASACRSDRAPDGSTQPDDTVNVARVAPNDSVAKDASVADADAAHSGSNASDVQQDNPSRDAAVAQRDSAGKDARPAASDASVAIDATPTRHCGPPTTATLFHPTGWAAHWSHVKKSIAFNKPDTDGLYHIFLMDPDGSQERRFGASNPAFPQRTTGSPYWHPSGRYIAFVAEKTTHPGDSSPATPGWGGYSDVWFATSDASQVWQVTNVPTDTDHGVLIPIFSPDGKMLEWAERTARPAPFTPAQFAGYWQLKLADFVEDEASGPRIENIRDVGPGPMNFSESGGFYPDSRALLITTAALTHNFWDNQIARVDLASAAINALTPGAYNEHPRFTRDGHIMWMTNTDNKQGTDWWWMLPDGSGAERLTRFNESDGQDGGTSAVWTGAVPADNWSDDGSWFLGDVETNLLTAGGEIRRVQLTCD